jgi:hypothetical protein
VSGGSIVVVEPSPPVIEYEPRRPLSPAAWLIRTPLRPDGVVPVLLVLAWLVLCTGNAATALRSERQHIVYTAPIYTTRYAPVALATVCGCFWGLGRMRGWRIMAACAAACLVSGVATGTVQITSCPHAYYLQVAGFYAPVWGDPCRNEQSDSLLPWWMH